MMDVMLDALLGVVHDAGYSECQIFSLLLLYFCAIVHVIVCDIFAQDT